MTRRLARAVLAVGATIALCGVGVCVLALTLDPDALDGVML